LGVGKNDNRSDELRKIRDSPEYKILLLKFAEKYSLSQKEPFKYLAWGSLLQHMLITLPHLKQAIYDELSTKENYINKIEFDIKDDDEVRKVMDELQSISNIQNQNCGDRTDLAKRQIYYIKIVNADSNFDLLIEFFDMFFDKCVEHNSKKFQLFELLEIIDIFLEFEGNMIDKEDFNKIIKRTQCLNVKNVNFVNFKLPLNCLWINRKPIEKMCSFKNWIFIISPEELDEKGKDFIYDKMVVQEWTIELQQNNRLERIDLEGAYILFSSIINSLNKCSDNASSEISISNFDEWRWLKSSDNLPDNKNDDYQMKIYLYTGTAKYNKHFLILVNTSMWIFDLHKFLPFPVKIES
jgi:hypothetical protein